MINIKPVEYKILLEPRSPKDYDSAISIINNFPYQLYEDFNDFNMNERDIIKSCG